MPRNLLPSLLVLALAVVLPAAQTPPPSPHPSLDRALSEADSLDRAGDRAAALTALRPAIAAARAAGDSARVLQGLLLQGRALTMSDRARDADAPLREALQLAEALADSERLCRALNTLSFVAGVGGRGEQARAFAERMREAAVAAHLPVHEATARTKLAQMSLDAGDAAGALPELEQTLALYRSLGQGRGEADVRNRLGVCLAALGRLDQSTQRFHEAVEIARREKLQRTESVALNNLAGNAHYAGNSDAALDGFRRVFEMERANGSARMIIAPACNLAELLGELGQYADAESTLAVALSMAQAAGEVGGTGQLLCALGSTRLRLEAFAAARDAYQRCLDLGDAVPVDQRIEALRGLAEATAALEGPQAGVALLEQKGRPLRPRASVAVGLLYDSAWADRLLQVGRKQEARAALERMDAACRTAGIDRYRVAALARIARCQQEDGHPDSALATLRLAADVWEAERSVPLDPAWREQRAADAREVAARWIALELQSAAGQRRDARRAAAFAVLQRFKGRTLVERVLGPGGQLAPRRAGPPTLRDVQTRWLRAGELLVETFVAADTAFVFAVTSDSCRVFGVPGGERELAHRMGLYRELVAVPTANTRANPAALAQASVELQKLLLDPIGDLVTPCRRVLYSPDGPLDLLALAQLRVAGAHGEGDAPLLDQHELVYVPAVALLSLAREAPAGAGRDTGDVGPGPSGLLVMSAVDDAGLPGARREVKLLTRRYASARRWVPAPDGIDSTAASSIGQYDIVHIAGHTRVDDQHPWRSAIVLAAAGDTAAATLRGTLAGEGRGLRASDIARLRLGSRLAVLSSCASAGGRVVSGEGVQGLTTAFLDAGVGTVVATLWPVDDSATAQWVRRFYRHLEKGESAAAALRGASTELRAAPLTVDPYYWAGFILMGDGDVQVRLHPRRDLTLLQWLGGAAVGVGAFELMNRRRRMRKA